MTFEERLRKKLREKLKPAGILPPKYVWKSEGEELLCRFIGIEKNPWRDEGNIWIIEKIGTGEKFRLPVNVVLNRELENQNARVGCYGLIIYRGKRGRVNLYDVAVLSEDEALEISREEMEEKKDIAAKPEEPSIKVEAEMEPKVKKEPEVKVKAELTEVDRFIRDELFQFYESLQIKDLMYFLNNIRGFNISEEEVRQRLPMLGLRIQGDKVVRGGG